MKNPKYNVTDRIKPIRGSFLFVIEKCLYDEENDTWAYQAYGLDSPSNVKIFYEDDVEFAGFTTK